MGNRVLLIAAVLCVSCRPAPTGPDAISRAERTALLSLFHATAGESWYLREGWRGPEGSECTWRGVGCDHDRTKPARHVTSLSLSRNNLDGTLPTDVSQLRWLTTLYLDGNRLQGPLPPSLLERFDRRELKVIGYAEQFARVRQIELHDIHTEFECADVDGTMRVDGTITVARKRCAANRVSLPYWEKGTARISPDDVDRVVRLLETRHFDRLLPSYSGNWTHADFVVITVTYRDRRQRTVSEYGGVGPADLWLFQKVLAGAFHEADIAEIAMAPDPSHP